MNLIFLLSFVSIAPAVAFPGPVAFRYEVKRLPGLSFSLQSWAGRFDVPNGASGDQIFFWLFAAEDKLADENLISQS
jgi:carboxypeptidase D